MKTNCSNCKYVNVESRSVNIHGKDKEIIVSMDCAFLITMPLLPFWHTIELPNSPAGTFDSRRSVNPDSGTDCKAFEPYNAPDVMRDAKPTPNPYLPKD